MLKQSAVYLLARAVPGAVNFLALLLYARILGPAEFGRLTLLVSAANILNAAALYWVRASYLRAAADTGDDTQHRATALKLNAALVTLLLIPASVAAAAGLVPWVQAFAVIAFMGVQNACETQQEFLRNMERGKAYGAVALVRALTSFAVGAALIILTPLGFFAPLIGLIVGALVGLLLARRSSGVSALASHVTPQMIRQYASYGLPLVPYYLTLAVFGTLDRFLINHFLGKEATGTYSAGYDMVQQTIGLLFIAINLAGLPALFRAFNQAAPVWESRARQHAFLILGATVAPALTVTLYAREITTHLLGSAYTGASVILPLIAWSTVLAGLRGNYYDVSFQVSKRTVWQLPAVLLGLALNVALGFILIPRMGLLGAAVASAASHGAALLTSALLTIRIQPMPLPLREWGRVGLSAAAFVLIANVTGALPAVLSAGLALAAYVLTAFALHRSARTRAA